MASERDPLEEISVDDAKMIRGRLKESRESAVRAQDLVDGVRKAAVVADGTQESLKTLSAKLGEAEEMYAKVFASITRTYGDDPDDVPVVNSVPEKFTEEEGT